MNRRTFFAALMSGATVAAFVRPTPTRQPPWTIDMESPGYIRFCGVRVEAISFRLNSNGPGWAVVTYRDGRTERVSMPTPGTR